MMVVKPGTPERPYQNYEVTSDVAVAVSSTTTVRDTVHLVKGQTFFVTEFRPGVCEGEVVAEALFAQARRVLIIKTWWGATPVVDALIPIPTPTVEVPNG